MVFGRGVPLWSPLCCAYGRPCVRGRLGAGYAHVFNSTDFTYNQGFQKNLLIQFMNCIYSPSTVFK
jgi:hypothetical protein